MINNVSMAQDFAPVGAMWHYTEQFAFQGDIDYLTIHSVKDTTILGYSCRRLDCKPLDGLPSRIQYIRFANDSLFRYVPEFNSFQLMVAFNAQKGDSWKYLVKDWDESIDTVIVKVNDVERITINQRSLRKLSVRYQVVNYDINGDSIRSEAYDSQIIERIGDIHYLFNFPISASIVIDGNYSAGLRCYEDAEFGLYSTGIAESCTYQYVYVGIKEPNNLSDLKFFPNPTDGWLHIDFGNLKDRSVQVTDLAGRCLMSETLNATQQIDLSALSNGLYIVTVMDKQKSIGHFKVVKNRNR
ncbi:MAG TPA: T9SS type A sorting domain-containing protein [Prolixibacteraceae bacterium]|nr:T9SS type A sorting domain-containing protein [Prolixibacteraceae bacterium]